MKRILLLFTTILLSQILVFGQFYKVKGIVTDFDNKPIEHACIVAKGMFLNGLSARTMKNGAFEIIMPKDSLLLVEHINYKQKQLSINDLQHFNFHIKLDEEVHIFDTLVVRRNDYTVEEIKNHAISEYINPKKQKTNDIQLPNNLGIISYDEKVDLKEEWSIFIELNNAEFPGGSSNFYKQLFKNLKPATELLTENEAPQATVSFMVDSLGLVKEIDIVKCDNPLLKKLIYHAFELLPTWKPAIQLGKPMSSRFILPLKFITQHTEIQH